MNIGEILYFSPKYKFRDLNWDNKEDLINAFRDRVKGFYLDPAKELNKKKYGFAAGVLCVATIDFLARFETGLLNDVRNRFEEWLKKHIEEFKDEDLAYRFYNEFRNGLIHEGRIKNGGQFSYEFDELVTGGDSENSPMIVNPGKLLEAIEKSFNNYIKTVEKDECAFALLKCALKRDFQKDIQYASRG